MSGPDFAGDACSGGSSCDTGRTGDPCKEYVQPSANVSYNVCIYAGMSGNCTRCWTGREKKDLCREGAGHKNSIARSFKIIWPATEKKPCLQNDAQEIDGSAF